MFLSPFRIHAANSISKGELLLILSVGGHFASWHGPKSNAVVQFGLCGPWTCPALPHTHTDPGSISLSAPFSSDGFRLYLKIIWLIHLYILQHFGTFAFYKVSN